MAHASAPPPQDFLGPIRGQRARRRERAELEALLALALEEERAQVRRLGEIAVETGADLPGRDDAQRARDTLTEAQRAVEVQRVTTDQREAEVVATQRSHDEARRPHERELTGRREVRRAAEREMSAARQNFESTERRLRSAQSDIPRLQEEIATLDEGMAEWEEALHRAERELEGASGPEFRKIAARHVETARSDLETAQRRRRTAQASLEDARDAVPTAERLRGPAQERIRQAEAALAEAKRLETESAERVEAMRAEEREELAPREEALGQARADLAQRESRLEGAERAWRAHCLTLGQRVIETAGDAPDTPYAETWRTHAAVRDEIADLRARRQTLALEIEEHRQEETQMWIILGGGGGIAALVLILILGLAACGPGIVSDDKPSPSHRGAPAGLTAEDEDKDEEAVARPAGDRLEFDPVSPEG